MNTLTCTKCKADKPLDEFNNSKTRKTGKRSYCKECERNDAKKFYKNNPEPYKKRAAALSKKSAAFYQTELTRVKAESGCLMCGESEPCVLDFHHVDRTIEKHTRVNVKMGHTGLMKELKKCVIVCANCHRKIHANVIQVNPDTMPAIRINKYVN